MKIAQFFDSNASKKLTNKSFQKELWDTHWSLHSTEQLENELAGNPFYWNLLDILKKEDRILEAGCGFGQWVLNLDRLGYNIQGIDIAENTISKLRKKYPELKIKLADVENLPFKDDSFKVYLSFGVIEHFPQGPHKVLSEANRVLKKNGLLYLTVPYLNAPRFIRYKFLKREKGEFYQYLYSKNDVVKYVKAAGFKVDKIRYFDFINAIRKDIPFASSLLNLALRHDHEFGKPTRRKFALRTKPNFTLQKILYRLDSYLILIEAYKK